MKRIHVLVMVIGMFVYDGCSDMGDEPRIDVRVSPPPVVSFRTQILPVFQRYGCESCHGGSGGLFLQTVAAILQGGDHGAAVVPGNPDSSLILKKLSSLPPFGDRMPQGGPYLPDSTITTIRNWIAQGARDN